MDWQFECNINLGYRFSYTFELARHCLNSEWCDSYYLIAHHCVVTLILILACHLIPLCTIFANRTSMSFKMLCSSIVSLRCFCEQYFIPILNFKFLVVTSYSFNLITLGLYSLLLWPTTLSNSSWRTYWTVELLLLEWVGEVLFSSAMGEGRRRRCDWEGGKGNLNIRVKGEGRH